MNGLTFEDLGKPFVCVATEIRTGHEIWLSSGSLITAMRASYALPGVFEPVTCNGRVLVDGALVNPVPVSVCRAYEQPLVVAVNLHYDLLWPRRGHQAQRRRTRHRARRNAERHRPTCSRARRGSASPASWSRPSTSSRTAFRAPGLPAIRRTCRCSRSSAISACPNSIAPTRRSSMGYETTKAQIGASLQPCCRP